MLFLPRKRVIVYKDHLAKIRAPYMLQFNVCYPSDSCNSYFVLITSKVSTEFFLIFFPVGFLFLIFSVLIEIESESPSSFSSLVELGRKNRINSNMPLATRVIGKKGMY